MHHSIPAVTIAPPPHRLIACIPLGDPQAFDTRVFESAIDKFISKDEAFVEDWLVRQGLDKLVDVFKGMFSQLYNNRSKELD